MPSSLRLTALFVSISLALSGAEFASNACAQPTPQKVGKAPLSQFKSIPSNTPKAPAGAPNVLLVMTDDVGFGASSTFGGPIPTPTYDELAKEGLRYNEFHTTAMCSPTRAALLTGRNHHAVNTGTVVDLATDGDGYTSVLPDSAATIGEVLKENGYDTAWLGKEHNVPEWEVTPNGPFDRWPTGLGFEYFYGFFGGNTNQFAPSLVENTRFIEPPNKPGYILDQDLADHAVSWLRTQDSVTPDKPFLLYLAPGSAHSPHMAPRDWIAKFKGKFDQGWDVVREQTFERQKRLGVLPKDAMLTPRPQSVPAWDTLSPDAKKVASRMMEVYAAQLTYFDDQLARVIAELKREGRYDNTLIMYIQGDNGASGEGTLQGTLSDTVNPDRANVAFMLKHLDEFGGPKSYENYPVGWAWAMDTPFQWTKQVASHFGGTRNGLVVSWPKVIKDRGGLRTQFHHVIDVAPTLYEAAGIRPPTAVHGVKQMPLDGVSMVYSFDHPDVPSAHRSQYFEMVGNRAFYKDGWIASTHPATVPWIRTNPPPDPQSYTWELYDLHSDYSQAKDVSQQYPQKLAELQHDFDAAAKEFHVNPISNDLVGRAPAHLRPYVTNSRTEFEYFPSDERLPDQAYPSVLNRSWQMDVSMTEPDSGNGTLFKQGGYWGGYGLFIFNGHPEFIYKASLLEDDLTRVVAPAKLSPGQHHVSVSFQAQPGFGAGAQVSLSIDGAVVATRTVPRTIPIRLVPEGIGIGRSYGTPLTDAYQVPFNFNGTVDKLDLKLIESKGTGH
jgi:arylsulfatase